MHELFGIGHHVDGFDPILSYMEREYRVRAAFQVANDTGLTVDLSDASGQVARHNFSEAADDRSRHVVRAVNQVRDGWRFASSIGMEFSVAGQ